MNFIWTNDTNSTVYSEALSVRFDVFIDEQKVPKELEVDEFETQALHLVLYKDNQAIGTARVLDISAQTHKIQRVAVIKEARNKGLGASIMKEIERYLQMSDAKSLTLGAQIPAVPFYKKLGYTVVGEEFMDAGIPQLMMTKSLI